MTFWFAPHNWRGEGMFARLGCRVAVESHRAAFAGPTKGNNCGTPQKGPIMGDVAFEEINEAKANMDSIYDQSDPRAYFRELEKLDYAIPNAAKPIFQKLITHRRRGQDDTVHVLDLGCSYGVNAALLKHDLSMDDLYQH